VNYNVNFEKRSDYLHAIVTGENSLETVAQYFQDIRDECSRQDCFRVLIEERLEGPRLSAMDIFSIVSEGSMRALGEFEALAYVDEQMGEMGAFAETIAINRGMPLAVFDSVAKAEEWISLH